MISNQDLSVNVVIDDWISAALVCPIAKTPVVLDDGWYRSEAGFRFPNVDGVPDFRVPAHANISEWQSAQIHFENWASGWFNQAEAIPDFYERLDNGDGVVYKEIPLIGSVLDVGGQLGFIRNYMGDGQRYCSIDPFVAVIKLAHGRRRLFSAYGLERPLNFICGLGEFLPFRSGVFDTVNMRSVIDHLANPRLALLEAYRVLKPGGQLIVGLQVDKPGLVSGLREMAKILRGIVIPRMRDKHIWHPAPKELHTVCGECGFALTKEYWQTNRILYARYSRSEVLAFG